MANLLCVVFQASRLQTTTTSHRILKTSCNSSRNSRRRALTPRSVRILCDFRARSGREAHLRANPLILLASCVNTPIDHNVFHNLRVHVARCSASCVNWAWRRITSAGVTDLSPPLDPTRPCKTTQSGQTGRFHTKTCCFVFADALLFQPPLENDSSPIHFPTLSCLRCTKATQIAQRTKHNAGIPSQPWCEKAFSPAIAQCRDFCVYSVKKCSLPTSFDKNFFPL